MRSTVTRLGFRGLALLAVLLPSACASPDDEPMPYRHAPQLLLQYPAVIEQDTVVTGLGQPFYLLGNYTLPPVPGGAPNPLFTATAARDGAAPRPLPAYVPVGRAPDLISYFYQPSVAQRTLITAEVRDGFGQIGGRTFWLRVLALPAPTVAFFTNLPPQAARGSRVTVRARLASAIDPPTELYLYHYRFRLDATLDLQLIGTVNEASLLAARQGANSDVDLPAFTVPANEPYGDYNLLLLGRTRHRMQAQTFTKFFVSP